MCLHLCASMCVWRVQYAQCMLALCRSRRHSSSCRHACDRWTMHRHYMHVYIRTYTISVRRFEWCCGGRMLYCKLGCVVVCTLSHATVLWEGTWWVAFLCRTLQGTYVIRIQHPLQVTPSCSVCVQENCDVVPLTESCLRHNQCHLCGTNHMLRRNV